MSTSRRLRRFVAVAACIAATSAVDAAPIRFDYTGKLRPIAYFGSFGDSFGYADSQTISGHFVVDLSVVDTDPSTLRAFRALSIVEMSFGQFTTEATAASYTYSLIDADPLHDNLQAYAQRQNGMFIDTFQFSLEAPTPLAVLVNDSPDLLSLRLSDFDLSDSRFTFLRVVYPTGPTLQGVQFTASFDSLTATSLTVPEPSSLALVLGSAALLAGQRRRTLRPSPSPRITPPATFDA